MTEAIIHKLKRAVPALIHRIPPLESALNYSWFNRINNKKFFIPVRAGIGESLLRIEADFKSELLQKLQGIFSGCFIDVGANTGQTILEACSAWDWPLYIAIEPSPECCAYLRRLVLANDLRAVQLLPWAVGEEPSPLMLYRSSETDASATINKERAAFLSGHQPATWIASFSLDQTLSSFEIPRSFFLKIDVEGFEASVLAGARRVLSDSRPLIQCEVLRAWGAHQLSQVGANMSMIENLLAAYDYVPMEIVLSRETSGKIICLKPILKFPRALYRECPSGIDYLFIPNELLPQVLSRFG